LVGKTGLRINARQVEHYLKAHGWRLRRPVRSVKYGQDPEHGRREKEKRL